MFGGEAGIMKKVLLLALLPLAAAFSQTVVATFDAPDTGINGLACGGGYLWALDGTTHNCYQVDPADGSVISSWYVQSIDALEPAGLAYGNNSLFAGMVGTSLKEVYIMDTAGNYLGNFTVNC